MNNKQNKFFHDLIAELLDIPKNKVIYSYLNNPMPTETFATIRYSSISEEVPTESIRSNEPEFNILIGHNLLNCEIQVFASKNLEACTMLCNLYNKLSMQNVVDRLHKANIAIVSYSNINDISSLLNNTNFKTRASIDLTIRFTPIYLDNVGYIANVNVNGNTGKDLLIKINTEE